MLVKFKGNSNYYKCSVARYGHVVSLVFEDKVIKSTKGFKTYTDDKEVIADYSGFTTVYRENYGLKGYMLSDDNSVWHEPVFTVTFEASEGGSLEVGLTQNVRKYEDLAIPEPVADEYYEFDSFVPAIPQSGFISRNQTFKALFRALPRPHEFTHTEIAINGYGKYDALDYSDYSFLLSDGEYNFEDVTEFYELKDGELILHSDLVYVSIADETIDDTNYKRVTFRNKTDIERINEAITDITDGLMETYETADSNSSDISEIREAVMELYEMIAESEV